MTRRIIAAGIDLGQDSRGRHGQLCAVGRAELGHRAGHWARHTTLGRAMPLQVAVRRHEWTATSAGIALFQPRESNQPRNGLATVWMRLPAAMLPMPVGTFDLPAKVDCTEEIRTRGPDMTPSQPRVARATHGSCKHPWTIRAAMGTPDYCSTCGGTRISPGPMG
jgi:hypothetical protein